MSEDTAGEVLESAASRWQRIDPLLPDPQLPAGGGCGTTLLVPAARGREAAAGSCQHRTIKPGAAELTWRATEQFTLTAHAGGDADAGPGTGAALGELLDRWRAHLAGEPAASGQDSQALLQWPSRDIAGVRTLLRHGLHPLTVIAARPAGRAVPDAGTAGGGLRIRRADAGDTDAVTAAAMQVVRFDQHFGSVLERPHTEQAEREAIAQALARPQSWTWLAERDGHVAGALIAEPPEQAGWMAPAVRTRPVAYLGTAAVAPGDRGHGVGTALVATLHRHLDAAGVGVTLLHHGQLNPLSAPFWNRMGYRPLWTIWEVRPASALRVGHPAVTAG